MQVDDLSSCMGRLHAGQQQDKTANRGAETAYHRVLGVRRSARPMPAEGRYPARA
jgi:hypothetical protein